MRDRWLVLGTVVTIGAAFAAAIAQAGSRTERFSLDPNLPRVSAKVSVTREALTVVVAGAPGGARVALAVDRLACTAGGGRRIATAVADSSGRAEVGSKGALPGRVRDGRHVLALSVGSTILACGSIPSGRATDEPARQRHWGIWSFARTFVD